MRPVGEWNDKELANLIANYQRLERVDDPYYLEALSEMARRKGGGLEFEKTFSAVLKAAKERRFLSYKQLAAESGVEWSKVRYAANQHLGDLIEYAHRMGWPLLSAIIVNQQNLADGSMEPSTLRGFCEAARSLGYAVADENAFLREQQQRVFEWAGTQEGTQ
ncbi:hypothetical protein [Agrobacterium salinitolerans]|uniref:Uncharacterized protein n=1 Tax=Agrobacterium salinitolerans TaxID=1183413 RepID=A0A9X3KQL9_9HYPH|nr:hypothetical protein [Agrobacterium salinitolerans]MCZ7854941.1 hypothetical protein [Agrobacterium salinitolerans]MCZ7938026.1 hypothetical protein [Agrobacterium salinitolerans]MCZ7973496.1 hypothetical protein [Agrobacterium salinitolerans]